MITFYPTVSMGELGKHSTGLTRALLPASSWAREKVKKYGRVLDKIPVPSLPETVTDRAADCGGFVATKKWGGYRYDPYQYVEWLDKWHPSWSATMDYCCEDAITSGNPDVVRERQDATTEMAHLFWNSYRDVSWVWVPTLQGWQTHEYLHHVQALKPLITEMHSYYGSESAFRVGIGTLCARASASMIREVVTQVARELPGIPLHLWGVKLSVFQSPLHLPASIVSCDSAAWNGMFRTGRQAWKESGMTQRAYCFKVALPAYEAKLQTTLSQPKQMRLEDIA